MMVILHRIYLTHAMQDFFPIIIKYLCYFPNIHWVIYTQCSKLFLTSIQHSEVVEITKLKQT